MQLYDYPSSYSREVSCTQCSNARGLPGAIVRTQLPSPEPRKIREDCFFRLGYTVLSETACRSIRIFRRFSVERRTEKLIFFHIFNHCRPECRRDATSMIIGSSAHHPEGRSTKGGRVKIDKPRRLQLHAPCAGRGRRTTMDGALAPAEPEGLNGTIAGAQK